MSFNLITEMQELGHDRNKGRSLNLLLDTLRLDYNQIQYLPAESFKHFSVLNRTYLTGNPIAYLEVTVNLLTGENRIDNKKIKKIFSTRKRGNGI